MVLPKTPVQNPFADPLQSSDASSINPIRPKPMNHSYSQIALFDTMKIRHRFCPHVGAKREFIFRRSFSLIKNHKILVWIRGVDVAPGVSGCWRGQGGRNWNNEQKGIKGIPPPIPTTGPRHILFWAKRGAPSVISFPNYFLEGEFCHVRTQQMT